MSHRNLLIFGAKIQVDFDLNYTNIKFERHQNSEKLDKLKKDLHSIDRM